MVSQNIFIWFGLLLNNLMFLYMCTYDVEICHFYALAQGNRINHFY